MPLTKRFQVRHLTLDLRFTVPARRGRLGVRSRERLGAGVRLRARTTKQTHTGVTMISSLKLSTALVASLATVLAWAGAAPLARAETPEPAPTAVVTTAAPAPANSAEPVGGVTPTPMPSAEDSAAPVPSIQGTTTPVPPAPPSTATPQIGEATPTPSPTPSPAAVEAVTNLPTLAITLTPGYSLDQIHADKGFEVPQDPDTEPLNTGTLVDPENPANDFSAAIEEIKGRGNSTWALDKKPYQIKFESKRPVLGMPTATTWILLANHADGSLLRNKVAYDLAAEFGLDFSPESRFIDLVINGEYLGNYLITEKVQVKTNRVELTHPSGVLVELDGRGEAEDHYFRTSTSRTIFVLKDAVSDIPDLPEPLPAETQAGWDDVRTDLNALDALLSADEPDWAAVSQLIDVDSFLRFYFLQEAMANPDVTFSSVYIYKDGPDDVLHAGPVWDFDLAEGNSLSMERGGDPTQEFSKNSGVLGGAHNDWFRSLYRIPSFVRASNTLFSAELADKLADIPAKVEAYAAEISQSAAANFERWPILGGPAVSVYAHALAETWEEEVDYLWDYLSTRESMLRAVNTADQPVLRYAAHVAERGWQLTHSSGQVVGTTGQGLPMEALSISVIPGNASGSLVMEAHVAELGWLGSSTTSPIGTVGRSLQAEAFRASLTGDLARDYSIEYRAHVAMLGWQPWVRDGDVAGTTGRGLGVEAFEMRLVRTTDPALEGLVPVHRFYNAANGTHFYTASEEEVEGVLARWPDLYTYEGAVYYVDPAQDKEPLYRFYNNRNGSHFYTASVQERDGVIARWPSAYTYEGVAYNVSTTDSVIGTEVYRFYNNKTGSHFYTTSLEERDAVIAKWSATYVYEGPRFYVSAAS